MRSLYSLFMYLATPLILLFLAFRGMRDNRYLQRWGERFGFQGTSGMEGGILVHAASVGEVNAAAPLVNALLQRYPDQPLTVTTFTPTGAARARELFGDRTGHFHIPLDLPGAVRRFYQSHQPRALIIMETEIWPNLYAGASRRNIPILLVNARMSESSLRGYQRISSLVRDALRRVQKILAQGESDASRYILCGADPGAVIVTGNLKFDAKVAPGLAETGESLRTQWGTSRLVLLAGSTHEADEAVVLEAFKHVLGDFPGVMLILAPRHPERFAACAEGARRAGLEVTMRSDDANLGPATQCLVIDSMGKLLPHYAACDLAFVGGSIAEVGGHNVLEPAALAKPVLVGPHTFNFEEITHQLIERGAAMRVQGQEQLAEAVMALFADTNRRDRMGRAGLALVESGRGALEKTVVAVEELLGETGKKSVTGDW